MDELADEERGRIQAARVRAESIARDVGRAAAEAFLMMEIHAARHRAQAHVIAAELGAVLDDFRAEAC